MRLAAAAAMLFVAGCLLPAEDNPLGSNGGLDGGTGGGSGGGGVGGGTATGGDAGSADSGTDGGRDGGTDAGIDGGPATPCFEDKDCPSIQLFFCNTTTSLCEPSCRMKAECTAAVRGIYALPHCDNNPLGCQCDYGRCKGALCSADSDCGTQACRNGVCVAPPAASTVASCDVVPSFVVMAAGSKARFAVLAKDAAGSPVVPMTGHVWSAVNAIVTGSGTSPTQDFAAAGTATAAGPVEAVQVALGAVTCRAKVIVLRNAGPADALDVAVIDELTGRPIAGAQVLLTVPATGLAIGAAQATDSRGSTQFAISTGLASASISVFHAEYDYQTISAYAVTGGSRSVIAALRRNPLDQLGGFKGSFTAVPLTTYVHMGSGGLAQQSFFEPRLLAPPIPTRVKIGSAVDQMDVPLAAASTMGFADMPSKDTYAVPGLNGSCHTAAGVIDEPTLTTGRCGGSVAFALTVDLPLGDLPIDLFAGPGLTNIDSLKLVSRTQPLFRHFNSSVKRDVEFSRAATQTSADGGWNLSNTSAFTVADLPFSQLPLAFSFVVRSPDLPTFRGKFAQIVLLRGVAHVPGHGLVELGLGSAVNSTPLDSKTDSAGGLPQAGLIEMRMAPTHHGLEGSEYAVVAAATTATDLNNLTEGSTIIARLQGNQLKFDQAGTTPVLFPTAYLGFPETARYNFTDSAQTTLAPRTLRFASPPSLPGATVTRVTFADRLGRRWVVLTDPGQVPPGFTLPRPVATYVDRTFWSGATTGPRSTMRVEAMAFADVGPIGFQRWVELGSGNPARTLDFSTASSFVDYQRPLVGWLTPAASGAVIAMGSEVLVKVTQFRVGQTASDDGFVRVFFAGGSSCPSVDVLNDPSGKGEIPVTVPAGCTGVNVQMIAELHEQATSAAVSPPVNETISVTIQ